MKGRRNKDSCVDNDRRRDPKWKQRRDWDPLPTRSRQQQSPPTRWEEWDPRNEEDAWDEEEGVEISEKEEAFLFYIYLRKKMLLVGGGLERMDEVAVLVLGRAVSYVTP
jgi:hypothetical protein